MKTNAKIRTPAGKHLSLRQYVALQHALSVKSKGGSAACAEGHFDCAAWEGGPCSAELAAQLDMPVHAKNHAGSKPVQPKKTPAQGPASKAPAKAPAAKKTSAPAPANTAPEPQPKPAPARKTSSAAPPAAPASPEARYRKLLRQVAKVLDGAEGNMSAAIVSEGELRAIIGHDIGQPNVVAALLYTDQDETPEKGMRWCALKIESHQPLSVVPEARECVLRGETGVTIFHHGTKTVSSFDRRGIEDSWYPTNLMNGQPREASEIAASMVDQMVRADIQLATLRDRLMNGVEVDFGPVKRTLTPAEIKAMRNKLAKGESVTLAPKGMGTAYRVFPTRLGRSKDPSAKMVAAKARELLGQPHLMYVTQDWD